MQIAVEPILTEVSPFEFLLMIYSIIAGLGLTLLLRSIGQLIEGRARIQFYWVHTAWIGIIFVAHVTTWFALWDLRAVDGWTVGQFLLIIAIPISLYLVSHLCVPEIAISEQRYDLREFFKARYRGVFALLILTWVLMTVSEKLLLHDWTLTPLNGARLVAIGLVAIGLISDDERLHALIAVAFIALVAVGMSVLDLRLD